MKEWIFISPRVGASPWLTFSDVKTHPKAKLAPTLKYIQNLTTSTGAILVDATGISHWDPCNALPGPPPLFSHN